MKIQTVNQLISVFKDIATRHYQINGFGIGDDWENGATEKTHPVLWINPVTASMPSTDNGYKTFEIDFEVKLFDLVSKDESNENDVLSDTIDILKDIIIEFKGHPYYVNSQLNIINDIDFESFTEEFDEEVSGWSCEISLMTPVLNNFCGIPAEDITGFEFPSADCPDVNVLCPVMVEDVTGVSPIVVTTIGNTKQISLSGGVSSDTFVTGATYNNTTNKLEIERNDGVIIYADLSSFSTTDTFLSSGNYNSTSDELELTLSDGNTINIDLSSLNNTDTNDYLDTLDFNSNTDNKLTATLSDGSVIDVVIDNFNDLTVNGDVTATAFIGDGSQLTGLASGGDNIANADLTLDDNRNVDFNNKHLTLGGSGPVDTEDFSIHKDTLIKGSDTSEVTSSLKVTDVNEDTTFDIRNNGQIGYGGDYLNTTAHVFRNPNNESVVADFKDGSDKSMLKIQTNGLMQVYNSSGVRTHRLRNQSGIGYIEGWNNSGVQYLSLQSGNSGYYAKRLNINDNTSANSKAVLQLNQNSTNTSQQVFFANITTTTTGRINSSSSFGVNEKGFECFDTDLNKKFIWNGSAWEQITSS